MADNDKVPFQADPLWVTGTVETNGTGGDESTENVSPAAAQFRANALARAAEDPSDDLVILPSDNDNNDKTDEEAIGRLKDAAKDASGKATVDTDREGAQSDVEDQTLSVDLASAEANGNKAEPTDAKVNPNAVETDQTSVTKAEAEKLTSDNKPGPRKRS